MSTHVLPNLEQPGFPLLSPLLDRLIPEPAAAIATPDMAVAATQPRQSARRVERRCAAALKKWIDQQE